jgi:hypothetical protein
MAQGRKKPVVPAQPTGKVTTGRLMLAGASEHAHDMGTVTTAGAVSRASAVSRTSRRGTMCVMSIEGARAIRRARWRWRELTVACRRR